MKAGRSRSENKEFWNHGKRKTEVPAGLHSAFGRLCHRHRQRVEVPLYCRSGRRRRICAVLPALSGHSGPAHHDNGVCGGACFPQEPGAGLSGTGKTGPEVAHPRLSHPRGLLPAHDVLHHRCRLDAALFLHDRSRQAGGSGRRSGGRQVHRNAGRPRCYDLLDGFCCGAGRFCVRQGPAERP